MVHLRDFFAALLIVRMRLRLTQTHAVLRVHKLLVYYVDAIMKCQLKPSRGESSKLKSRGRPAALNNVFIPPVT